MSIFLKRPSPTAVLPGGRRRRPGLQDWPTCLVPSWPFQPLNPCFGSRTLDIPSLLWELTALCVPLGAQGLPSRAQVSSLQRDHVAAQVDAAVAAGAKIVLQGPRSSWTPHADLQHQVRSACTFLQVPRSSARRRCPRAAPRATSFRRQCSRTSTRPHRSTPVRFQHNTSRMIAQRFARIAYGGGSVFYISQRKPSGRSWRCHPSMAARPRRSG